MSACFSPARFAAASFALTMLLAAAETPAIAADHAAHHGGVKLSATLNGANEVDAKGTAAQGDPDGSGSFAARLVPGQGQLCYTLTSASIDAPTMAHIHSGAAGVSGPVFVPLTELAAGEHCIAIPADKATAIVAKPGDYYVNIHNGAFPGGAVRGQLVKN